MKKNISKQNNKLIAMEDTLKEVYTMQLTQNNFWTLGDLIFKLGVTEEYGQDICKALVGIGWVQKTSQDQFELTQLGKDRAIELIRAHRLWEQYLVAYKGYPLEALHAEAHEHEHDMSTSEVEALDDDLGYPVWDPHGHAIPEKDIAALPKAGEALSSISIPGGVFRIVAVDDHPEDLLAQFVALGIKPGTELTVVELDSKKLKVKVGDQIFPLALSAAQHISIVPVAKSTVPLGKLKVGQRAQILELKGQGKLQRRLLSMGFVPGAFVSVIRQAPFGDPVQYRIKKANIALRRKEADKLIVKR